MYTNDKEVKMLTLPEFAHRLGVTRQAIYFKILKKEIKFERVSHYYMIPETELVKFKKVRIGKVDRIKRIKI